MLTNHLITCRLLSFNTCTHQLELNISNTITVHLTGFRRRSYQLIVMLPQIRKIFDAQLFVYVSLTTYHFASASNKRILCALIPPEFCLLHWEKLNPNPPKTQMSLQHTVYKLLHISYYPLLLANTHGHRPELPLEFYFCWFWANRKKRKPTTPQKTKKCWNQL